MIRLRFKPFNADEERRIISAIKTAESQSTGEIRVHVERSCKKKDVLDRAVEIFYQLNMDKTSEGTGILIYVSIKDRKLAIIGDKGINQKVSEDFWHWVKESMSAHLKEGKIATGIIKGIEMTGAELLKFFPASENNRNELNDSISIG